MALDPVTLDFAFGLSAVRVEGHTLLLTHDESAAWQAAVAAQQVDPQEPARPLIVRSGPQAKAMIAEMIEMQVSVGQSVQRRDARQPWLTG